MQGYEEAFRKQFLPATEELFAFQAQEVLFFAILNPQVRIDARHIPLATSRRPAAERSVDRFGSLQEVREAVEREYILKKLEETSGNVTRTAELLGLERSNLYRKMKALGIGPKE